MNKIKKFLQNRGMYLVAICSVAAICLAGLYIAKNLNGEGGQPSGSQTPISATKDAQDVIAVPTKKNEITDVMWMGFYGSLYTDESYIFDDEKGE